MSVNGIGNELICNIKVNIKISNFWRSMVYDKSVVMDDELHLHKQILKEPVYFLGLLLYLYAKGQTLVGISNYVILLDR